MPRKPESKFVDKIKRDLDTIPGCWYFKSSERARRGIPDVIACIRGDFVAIEAKIDGKKPDPLQELTLKRIRDAGGVAFSTTPATWAGHFDKLKKVYSLA